MSKSPWSAYGRTPQSSPAPSDRPERDPTLGAITNYARGREQLDKYLNRALAEYREIRAGRTGYQKIIAAALDPSPGPESIEERLRRLSGETYPRRANRGPGATPR